MQTDYIYDALNRVITRNYSTPNGAPANYQPTPNVSYFYDDLPNAKGKLIKVTNGTGADRSTTEYTAFDILGRVTQSKQTTDGVTYGNGSTDSPMTYAYNLSGAMVEQKYPSGRVVRNVLDNDGDLAIVQSKKNANAGFWNYAESFTYTAAGAVSSMQLGNGKWESTQFNSRLQPTRIALGTVQNGTDKLRLDYDYGTWENGLLNFQKNNGNVAKQTITVLAQGSVPGFTAVQKYEYDSLNRLQSATENIDGGQAPSWKQTFAFDRYGNRRFDEGSVSGQYLTTTLPRNCPAEPNLVCPGDNPTANPTNNRLNGFEFDAAGNTIKDPSSRKFTYDGENKQIKVETVNSSGIVTATHGIYFYDGDGKRVKKIGYENNQIREITIFVYDAGGKMVAEYSTLPNPTPQVSYLTSDHLGSPRINTDANGNVIARHDFQPFGEEIQRASYGTDDVRQKFTSYERDNETGLDFAQARYFASGHGRFSSPDNFLNGTRPSNPASWNLYVYVLNNPLRFIDPTGELEKDETGKVKFKKTGEDSVTTIEKVKDANGNDVKINGRQVYAKVTYKVELGLVTANDGKTKIEASKNGPVTTTVTDSQGNALQFNKKDTAANAQVAEIQSSLNNLGYDATSDCHGTSFAEGQVWINNNQVEKLLKADGYRSVTGDEGVQAGDVAVYSKGFETRKDGTIDLKGVQHSATFNGDYSVKSKSGIQPLQNSISMGPGQGTAWSNPNTKLTVWTLRAKQ